MMAPSLAERATISAQETVLGHSLSSSLFIVWMYLKFLIPKFLSDFCSDTMPLDSTRRIEASQDCINHNRDLVNGKRYIVHTGTSGLFCIRIHKNSWSNKLYSKIINEQRAKPKLKYNQIWIGPTPQVQKFGPEPIQTIVLKLDLAPSRSSQQEQFDLSWSWVSQMTLINYSWVVSWTHPIS